MGWKAAIVSEPAASRGSSTGRTKAGQMAAGTAHARWGSARRARLSIQPAFHFMDSRWPVLFMKISVSPHACNSALHADAYVYAFGAPKVLKHLFFSRFHQVSGRGLPGYASELECGRPGVVSLFFSLFVTWKRFAAGSCE